MNASGFKILLVEDDAALAASLAEELTALGHQVVAVPDIFDLL